MVNDTLKQLLTYISKGNFKVAYSNPVDGYFEGYIERIKGAIREDNNVSIWFEGGYLIIDANAITQINKPVSKNNECEWCYEIKSQTGILMGWILKDKELIAI